MTMPIYQKTALDIHSLAFPLFGSSFFLVKATISALSLSRSDISGTLGSFVSPF
jgi:hypothetical protein